MFISDNYLEENTADQKTYNRTLFTGVYSETSQISSSNNFFKKLYRRSLNRLRFCVLFKQIKDFTWPLILSM